MSKIQPRKRKPLPAIKKVPKKRLLKDAKNGNLEYVGSTNDPKQRQKQHVSQDGLKGGMEYCSTKNKKRAENEALKAARRTKNKQKKSNAPNSPGFVYGHQKQKKRNKNIKQSIKHAKKQSRARK